jgi:hypothetical protein
MGLAHIVCAQLPERCGMLQFLSGPSPLANVGYAGVPDVSFLGTGARLLVLSDTVF